MELNFYHVAEFESDLEEISKKYRNIPVDLENFKKVLNARAPHNIFHGAERITYFGSSIKIPVYKAKHFRSRDLKGKGVKTLTPHHFREHIQAKCRIQIPHTLWDLSNHAARTHLKMVDLAVFAE